MSKIISNKICFPYLLEDMIVVLMRCLSEPPRLKADHVTFLKKVEQQLCSQLVELPPQVMGNFSIYGNERITEAVKFLFNLKLTTKAGMSSKSMNLVISELGHKWLNSSTEKKLETIYIGLHNAQQKSRIVYINTFKFAPSPIPIMLKRSEYDPTTDLMNAMTGFDDKCFVNFDEFIKEQVTTNNPLVKYATEHNIASITIGQDHFIRDKAELHLIWADYIKTFLYTRLFSLGGLTFGFDENGHLMLSLNKSGLFLVGVSDKFSYNDTSSEKIIIVQPDFDVIFLAPSPTVESRISQFADKIGSGIGVLFKITKSSIMRAATIEMTYSDVMSILSEYSIQTVSENVEIEIKNWFSQCRYFVGRETYLIKCPDKPTMMRILEVAGTQVTPLSDVILELKDPTQKIPFLKLMKNNGIFLKPE